MGVQEGMLVSSSTLLDTAEEPTEVPCMRPHFHVCRIVAINRHAFIRCAAVMLRGCMANPATS